MLMKIDYLQRRGGKLRYRRRIPEDIRPYFGGRAEIVQSLGLNAGDEAKAIALIKRIDRDISVQFLEAARAAHRKEDPAVLAKLAEEWAIANKFLGVDRSGLENPYDPKGPSNYDTWLDGTIHAAEQKIGTERELDLSDLSLEDQYRIETVKSGKRVTAPLTIETAIETYATMRHAGELPKAESAAFSQLREWLGKSSTRYLSELSRSMAREFLGHLANARQQRAGTIRRRLNSLRALWSFSIDHYELTFANPWARLEVPVATELKPVEERLPFNAAHWDKIDTLLMQASGDIRDVLLLLKFTGCRPLEIAGLAVDDVVRMDGLTCLRIRKNEFRRIKNRESDRLVPLVDPQAVSVIERRLGETGSLFPETLHGTSNLSARLNHAIRKAGIPQSSRLTAYSIRHSVTEALRVAGAPDHHMKAILGHADATTTARYGAGGVDVSDLARSLQMAQAHLGKVPLHIYEAEELLDVDATPI
ncbi:tyrosine-type recombinase/integrase [Henriciella barbarensis]|nr:tyrosine-type recombinase/integrase [Henriciella barbarensis]